MRASWLLVFSAVLGLLMAQVPDPPDENKQAVDGGNSTARELEVFGEAAEYLLELHQFFVEYERLKAQSKAEEILQDAFTPVFTKVAVVRDEAKTLGSEDIAACVAEAEEYADQTLADMQGLLGQCYNMVPPEDDSAQEEEENEALRQEVADFLQVALRLLQVMSDDASDTFRNNKQLNDVLSAHAIMLARNFQKTRVLVRNCVDFQLEEAYQQADTAVERAAACLHADSHDEL